LVVGGNSSAWLQRLNEELQDSDPLDRLVGQLLRQQRGALFLHPNLEPSLEDRHLRLALDWIADTMCLVPSGAVDLHSRREELTGQSTSGGRSRIEVSAFFLDRYAVTNREFRHFVRAGGYSQMELWEPSIWPAMADFVDSTRQPGPQAWRDGLYPAHLADHPVTGVCWHEVNAYARWVGKRLPTDAEWVKAGVWPVGGIDGVLQQRRFPWGDVFDPQRANIWGSHHNETVPVHAHENGASVNGVQQLVGNVWEWTSSDFGAYESANLRVQTEVAMKSIRGGAFDTYFENQVACQFPSGDDPLARRANIGFRLALSWSEDLMQLEQILNEADDEPSSPLPLDLPLPTRDWEQP
jgi:iron(II)-dependent oxidoreductase